MRRFGPPGEFGFSLDFTPVVRKLLIANGVIWLLQVIFHRAGSGLIEHYFALHPDRAIPWAPWQLFTYMFLHGGLLHILVNMLMLLVIGGAVERELGSRRFWRYYVICGLAGGLLSLVPPLREGSIIGASGAVLGVLVAFGLLFPNRTVYVLVIFFFVPVAAKYLVIFLALINLISAATSTHDGIAYMAHVGGMAAGYVMLRGVPFTNAFRRRWAAEKRERRAQRREEIRRELDRVLDKMHQQGKESLTREEWNILLEASRRRHED